MEADAHQSARPAVASQWLPLGFAVAVYLVFCWLQGIQTAGLQFDEAISYRGASVVLTGNLEACGWDGFVSFAGRCWPVMLSEYVGTPKDYLLLPAFAMLGVRTGVARLGAALLAALGIVGVWFFLREIHSPAAAAAGALILAVHPSYISLPLFDNGNIAFSFGVMGLTLVVGSTLMRGVSRFRVLLLGLLTGLGVWARLNFVWFLASALVAVVLVYRRDLLRAVRHLPAFAVGAVIGVLPALLYLSNHVSELLAFMKAAAVDIGLAKKLGYFLSLLADVSFAGIEHRTVWGGMRVPVWEGEAALALIVASLVWCAAVVRTRVVRCLCIGNVAIALFYAFSKLPIAEHHLVGLLPFEILLVAVSAADLWRRYGLARVALGAGALLYGVGALAYNVEAIQKIHSTRGVGEWSAGIVSLKNLLDQQGPRPLYDLDWGLGVPLLVLSGGHLNPDETYFGATAETASDGRKWVDLVQAGGIFLTYDNRYLHFPLATLSFRRALECAHSSYQKLTVSDHPNSPYALVYVVEPQPRRETEQSAACAEGTGETFLADPNPIQVNDGTNLGVTTLFFSTKVSRYVEIHLNQPDGPLFARFAAVLATNSGATTTGKWVRNGMTFFLQDVSGGKALSAENTIAKVTVAVNRTPPGK